MFDQWDDLMLTGVFKPREALLRGLSLEQVSAVPTGAPHSIYQELWHATTVLRMSLDEGRVALETWPYDEHFPERHEPRTLATEGEERVPHDSGAPNLAALDIAPDARERAQACRGHVGARLVAEGHGPRCRAVGLRQCFGLEALRNRRL